jgi:uncharacterized protein YdeI (YjbR/CyaY-like superfamily)
MKSLPGGTVHTLPKDLEQMLNSSAKAKALWEDITPLARNEWICWTVSCAKTETRAHHIKVAKDKMLKGMRRPCCWSGCPHRERSGR